MHRKLYMTALPGSGQDQAADSGRISFAASCLNNEKFREKFQYRTYASGQCIREEGDGITHLGIVVSGVLKAVSYSRNGTELCNAYFNAQDSFPEFLYLTGSRLYTYSLYVEKKARICWIPIPVLEEMLGEDPALTGGLLNYLSQQGLKNQLYLNCLNYQTIRERVAFWILGIQKIEEGDVVHMPGSQKILANMLHVSRSSLNQELRQMQREGYFSIEKEMMYDINEELLGGLL